MQFGVNYQLNYFNILENFNSEWLVRSGKDLTLILQISVLKLLAITKRMTVKLLLSISLFLLQTASSHEMKKLETNLITPSMIADKQAVCERRSPKNQYFIKYSRKQINNGNIQSRMLLLSQIFGSYSVILLSWTKLSDHLSAASQKVKKYQQDFVLIN